MGENDLDPSLAELCRQLVSDEWQNDSKLEDSDNGSLGNLSISLNCLPLHDYTQRELKFLSKSLGQSRLGHIQIEGVKDLDWDAILNKRNSTLKELSVTIRSTHTLECLIKSLLNNNRLKFLELDYYPSEENFHDDQTSVDNRTDSSERFIQPSSMLYPTVAAREMFFESLMPLQTIILRGLFPSRPTSPVLHQMNPSWQQLIIEECDITGSKMAWLASCILNLRELSLTNCYISEETIQVLSNAYLNEAMLPMKGKRLKHPLRFLNLSENKWYLPIHNKMRESEKGNESTSAHTDYNGNDYDCHQETRSMRPSCSGLVASLLDSLSSLIELNLSSSCELFREDPETNIRGMVDLCGTVNQSLKRLSLRKCGLIPGDLKLLVNTFCWLEALDLSENPGLSHGLTPLSQLDHLTELVLENMIEISENESFEFERLLCDEDLDVETMGHGIADLLFELWSGEREQFYAGSPKRRRKPLTRLNLSGNILSIETLKILSAFSSLKVLILIGCQVNADGLRELLSSPFETNECVSPLRELYISSNVISDVGALLLARCLREQHFAHLKVLDLQSNVISVEAFRVLVENGLIHSKRLESLEVSNMGAITRIQQEEWNRLEELMDHNLLLNQSGQFTLYMDHCEDPGIRRSDTNSMNECRYETKISSNLWPYILETADSIYGTDALFHFLHKRPDLILSPHQVHRPSDSQIVTPLKSRTKSTYSPTGVTDIANI